MGGGGLDEQIIEIVASVDDPLKEREEDEFLLDLEEWAI